MKDMTEKEARAALKKSMPWAKGVTVIEPSTYSEADVEVYHTNVCISGTGPTLRTAVRRCIAAAKKVGAAK